MSLHINKVSPEPLLFAYMKYARRGRHGSKCGLLELLNMPARHLKGAISIIISCTVFCFVVALRPKSTAKVMAGRSVHLTTLFPGQA